MISTFESVNVQFALTRHNAGEFADYQRITKETALVYRAKPYANRQRDSTECTNENSTRVRPKIFKLISLTDKEIADTIFYCAACQEKH